MAVCAAIKQDDVRCRARAMKGYAYCYNHHPGFADERRLHASKASKEIIGMLCLALAPLLARLETIERFREALSYLSKSYINEGVVAYLDGYQAGAKRAWEAAGKVGDPPEWKARKGGDEGDEGPGMD